MTKHTLNTPATQSAMSMVRYDAAIRALAECKAVDEVKTWADKAAALQAYGRMAKDKTLEVDAAEIRIRAERRLGEMIAEQKATVGLNTGAMGIGKSAVVTNDRTPKPTLSDAGISKDLSSRAQKLAAVPEEEFEKEVKDWRGRVEEEGKRVTARLEQAGEREIKKADPGKADDPDALRQRIQELEEELREAYAFSESMAEAEKILAADDQVAQAWEEVKRLKGQVSSQESRISALMREKNEYIREAKRWKRKFEDADKALKALDQDSTFAKGA